MPRYAIHTTETVHGVYYVTAADEDEVLEKFEMGDLPTPSVFESVDAEIDTTEVLPEEEGGC